VDTDLGTSRGVPQVPQGTGLVWPLIGLGRPFLATEDLVLVLVPLVGASIPNCSRYWLMLRWCT